MVWNKRFPGGSDQRLLVSGGAGGFVKWRRVGLLNLDLEVMESLFGLARGQKAHCKVLRFERKVRIDCFFREFCCGREGEILQ